MIAFGVDTCFDLQAVARYAENSPRMVLGYADTQRRALLLYAERARDGALVPVLGVGREREVFAEAQPGWSFVGVDPAAAMPDLPRTTLGALADRVQSHRGYRDSAPEDPFDAAACIMPSAIH